MSAIMHFQRSYEPRRWEKGNSEFLWPVVTVTIVYIAGIAIGVLQSTHVI